MLALVPASPVLAATITFTYITIDFPGATLSDAAGINNSGQIVGDYILVDWWTEVGTAFWIPGVLSPPLMTLRRRLLRKP
jgi:hypothetical protein